MTFTNEHGDELEIDGEGDLINGVLVRISLSDVIQLDLEGFLDRISEDAGIPLLTEQAYEIEGFEDGDTLILRVRGNVRMQMEEGA